MKPISRHVVSKRYTPTFAAASLVPARSSSNYRPLVTRTYTVASQVNYNDTHVVRQLRRVEEMQARVAGENSKVLKQRIIAEYPDLREVLELVYDPTLRTHLSYPVLRKYLASQPVTVSKKTTAPNTIIDLLKLLSSRQVTGNEAKDTVVAFLHSHGILSEDNRTGADSVLIDVFGRLLDRNLVAGFGARTLRDVSWGTGRSPTTTRPATEPPADATEKADAASPSTPTQAPSRTATSPKYKTPLFPDFHSLQHLHVALGKSISPPFTSLFSSQSKSKNKAESIGWYASRKLDGVRAITFIDFLVPAGNQTSPLEVVSVHFVSRSSKEFHSLGKLEAQLRYLSGMEQIRQWLDNDPEIVAQHEEGVIKRLVLDGEICVMRRETGAERTTVSPQDDGSASSAASVASAGSAASAIWSANDVYTEDFPATISAIRRQTPIPHLSYFVFDVLSWTEVRAGTAIASHGLSKTFSDRYEDVKALSIWLNEELRKRGVAEHVVKDLVQWPVTGPEDIEGMVQRASDEGWEGLIFRAEKPYRGKRSSDIRKFKKWQDAEYRVLSADTSVMRLSINGEFGEHTALSNVWIEHSGHRVSVGSGFTAEQRLRYAQDPNLIVGKMITVEYFSESEAVGREGTKKSLRFPRVKAVWEEGRREV